MYLMGAAIFLGTVASLGAAELCVENASGEAAVFTVASDSGGRALATLAPGARLCLFAPPPGVVAVFEDRDDLEGCSRRVEGPGVTRLIDFPAVDLCVWE